jgi:hypothetical protein
MSGEEVEKSIKIVVFEFKVVGLFGRTSLLQEQLRRVTS